MTTAQLDRTFAALADPTRREILARLASGDATVSELAEPLPISIQAVSKHLKVLEDAGLITRGRTASRVSRSSASERCELDLPAGRSEAPAPEHVLGEALAGDPLELLGAPQRGPVVDPELATSLSVSRPRATALRPPWPPATAAAP